MGTGVDEEPESGAAFELAAGCVGVVAGAFVAAASFGPAEQAARALVMAVGVGVLATVLRDRRAVAGVTVIAALVFVGFLAHQAGQLTGDPAPWRFTLLLGLAAVLGRAHRWMHSAPHILALPRARQSPRRSDRAHSLTRSASAGS